MFDLVSMFPRNRVGEEIHERLVKNFIDLIVLKEMVNDNLISAYDILALIHKKFHLLVSCGTIYSRLYSMERDGLIESIMTSKKRVYRLTEKGKEKLKNISESSDEILLFTKSLLSK